MDSQIERSKDDRAKAAEVLDCPAHYLDYFAWPQAFSSTAGPFGGIGGQAVTTFTLEAWSDGRNAAIFCGGKFIKVTYEFEFKTNVIV